MCLTGISFSFPEVRRLPLYFLNEPPNTVQFLNTAGVVVTCNAGGSPPPIIIWQKADGEIISETSDGLRYVRSDGSLVFRSKRAWNARESGRPRGGR